MNIVFMSMPSAELEKAVNERGISSRTMRTAKSRIGDRLVTEKEGTASPVCRSTAQEELYRISA